MMESTQTRNTLYIYIYREIFKNGIEEARWEKKTGLGFVATQNEINSE